jgi:hypothetical protein
MSTKKKKYMYIYIIIPNIKFVFHVIQSSHEIDLSHKNKHPSKFYQSFMIKLLSVILLLRPVAYHNSDV